MVGEARSVTVPVGLSQADRADRGERDGKTMCIIVLVWIADAIDQQTHRKTSQRTRQPHQTP